VAPANDEVVSQRLVELRDLNKKLIVIKNKQLDLLCDKIITNERQMKINTPFLELIVVKVSTISKTREITFVQSDPKNTVTVPVDELLRQNLQLNPNARDVCIQVSFMKTNPVAGYNIKDQYTVNNGVYVQMDSLDNDGYRLLTEEAGFQYL